jgi:hypothetical protein
MAKKRMIIAAASVVASTAGAVPPANLELVFVERNGRKQQPIGDMPVRIVDEKGDVVFEGRSEGPRFVAKLPKGKYIVSTRWDAWSFSRPVTIGKERQRVVFAWGAPSAAPVA